MNAVLRNIDCAKINFSKPGFEHFQNRDEMFGCEISTFKNRLERTGFARIILTGGKKQL